MREGNRCPWCAQCEGLALAFAPSSPRGVPRASPDRGRASAAREGLAEVEQIAAGCYEPALNQLQGQLLLASKEPDETGAEASFRRAIAIARGRSAKSFELRAASSLARLWRDQGKRTQAHDLLAPVYDWFTEGFDTLDLQETKTLLNELAR